MKKSLKILTTIIILLLVLLITYVVLIITKVIPNPFLDISDLYCYRDGVQYTDYKKDKYIIFSFDKWSNLKIGKVEEHLIYNDEELAKQEFSDLQELFNDYSNETLRLDDKTIIIEGELSNDEITRDMNKKQIKERYKEFNYECK